MLSHALHRHGNRKAAKSALVGGVLLPGSAQLPVKCSKNVLKTSVTATTYRVCSQPTALMEIISNDHLAPEAFPFLPKEKWKISTMQMKKMCCVNTQK